MQTQLTNVAPVSFKKGEDKNYDMIVFSHLRWGFVYQRPQHIISRMAADLKILVIEEPIAYIPEEENSANLIAISENLHILQPRVKDIETIGNVIKKYLRDTNIQFGWFYSAAFVPLLEHFNFDTVVYDCMDELSLFKGASQILVDQEKFLMGNANIVFTGGKSLYEAKSQLHANVFCFPSSVDRKHFASADTTSIPDAMASIKSPIVGYYGVIDERIDLELLSAAASRIPEISFVMIGPLAKISDDDLPRASNIHYLGMKTYEELPAYLNMFDIAMMPFALNDSTRFISPTKTLEFMAAGKPIISTRITDVVRDYSHCVAFADDAAEFCTAIADIFANYKDYGEQYLEILDGTSWDSTVNAMSQIIKTGVK